MDITLLTEAAYECMSPDQMNAFEALFTDADLARRYANCVRKRLPSAPQTTLSVLTDVLFALTERQKGNVIRSEDAYVDAAHAFLSQAPIERMSDAKNDHE